MFTAGLPERIHRPHRGVDHAQQRRQRCVGVGSATGGAFDGVHADELGHERPGMSRQRRGRWCADRLGSARGAFPDHATTQIVVAQLAHRLAGVVEDLEGAVDMVGQQPGRDGTGDGLRALVDGGLGRVIRSAEQPNQQPGRGGEARCEQELLPGAAASGIRLLGYNHLLQHVVGHRQTAPECVDNANR